MGKLNQRTNLEKNTKTVWLVRNIASRIARYLKHKRIFPIIKTRHIKLTCLKHYHFWTCLQEPPGSNLTQDTDFISWNPSWFSWGPQFKCWNVSADQVTTVSWQIVFFGSQLTNHPTIAWYTAWDPGHLYICHKYTNTLQTVVFFFKHLAEFYNENTWSLCTLCVHRVMCTVGTTGDKRLLLTLPSASYITVPCHVRIGKSKLMYYVEIQEKSDFPL